MTSSSSSMSAAAGTTVSRSFFRSLVPFRYSGNGVATNVVRSVYFQHEHLISRTLKTLELAPLPSMPRMMFAEGFQMMLDKTIPIRDVRAMFEDATTECRRWLHKDEGEVAVNPILRLLGFELFAASVYYESLLSISPTPQIIASLAARGVFSSDIKSDRVLKHTLVYFFDLERDPQTGQREPCPLDVLIRELLLVERDAFGKHRFDPRGQKRYVLGSLELEQITMSDSTFAFLKDPVVSEYGNFDVSSGKIEGRQWRECRVSCSAAEDSRIDLSLPMSQSYRVRGDGWQSDVVVDFDKPICNRMLSTNPSAKVRELGDDTPHTEVFELAIPDTNLTFFEKWFQR